MGRTRSGPASFSEGVRKGPWSISEDEKLREYVTRHGHASWKALPGLAGLNRCGKSCRLRWMNYLRPEIKRGKFSPDEESLIIHLHSQLGNRWSTIAAHLPGRTDNEIKNLWNTRLKKKLLRTGIDPKTHMPLPKDPHEDLLAQLLTTPPTWEVQAVATELAKLQMLNTLMETIRSLSSAPFLALDSSLSLGPYPFALPAAVELPEYPSGGNPNAFELSPPAMMDMDSWRFCEGDKTSSDSGLLPGLSSGEISAGAISQRGGGESTSSAESSPAITSIFEDLDKLLEEDMTFLKEIFD